MRARILGPMALALLTLGACHFGPSIDDFGPAQHAAGATAELELSHGTLQGELLEVRDSCLIVLNQKQVLLVKYGLISDGTFDQASVKIKGGKTPDVFTRTELARLSRFPQGLSPALESQLLAAYHQSAMMVEEP